MLARHAESLFWAGRYLERAEDTARLLDVTYHSSLGATTGEVRRAWRRTLDILRLRKEFEHRDEIADERAVPRFLVVDRANPGSIVSSVATARENFRSVREQLSSEVWESVNRFHHEMQARNLRPISTESRTRSTTSSRTAARPWPVSRRRRCRATTATGSWSSAGCSSAR